MSKLIYLLQVLLITYILFGLWLYIDQSNHLYHPNSAPIDAAQLPGFEAKTVKTHDNLKLRAWYHKGSPTLVYFHGNSGNAGSRYPNIKPFIDKGWGVLIVPYRGYGGNPGKPSEDDFYLDAELSLRLVHKSNKSCTVLFGRSLGSGVATYIARKYHAASLVLISPFTSVPDVAADYYPIYPVHTLAHERFNSLARINLINMPLLVMHGTDDRVVPYRLGFKLFKNAHDPKKFITLDNKGHNDLSNQNIAKAVFQFTKPFLNGCHKRK